MQEDGPWETIVDDDKAMLIYSFAYICIYIYTSRNIVCMVVLLVLVAVVRSSETSCGRAVGKFRGRLGRSECSLYSSSHPTVHNECVADP